MKRFLLFAGDSYYPEGGANDFKCSFETVSDEIEAHDPNEFKYNGGWANIFDLEEEVIVKKFEEGKWYEGNHFIF